LHYLQLLEAWAACKQLVVNIVGHAQPMPELLLFLSCIPSYQHITSLLCCHCLPSMDINHSDDQAVIILQIIDWAGKVLDRACLLHQSCHKEALLLCHSQTLPGNVHLERL
jgi:hypothetical protein